MRYVVLTFNHTSRSIFHITEQIFFSLLNIISEVLTCFRFFFPILIFLHFSPLFLDRLFVLVSIFLLFIFFFLDFRLCFSYFLFSLLYILLLCIFFDPLLFIPIPLLFLSFRFLLILLLFFSSSLSFSRSSYFSIHFSLCLYLF